MIFGFLLFRIETEAHLLVHIKTYCNKMKQNPMVDPSFLIFCEE